MTPREFEYIKRAVKTLEEPLSLTARIKVERTMGQILTKSADNLEQILVDNIEDRLYNKDLNNT
jgi:hypothetical protein